MAEGAVGERFGGAKGPVWVRRSAGASEERGVPYSRRPVWGFEWGALFEIWCAGFAGMESTGVDQAGEGHGEPCECCEEQACV
jgi:hypothetical protein